MNRISALARQTVLGGVAAIAVLAPTQYGIDIMGRATLSLVDPLIWLVFAFWLTHTWLDAKHTWTLSNSKPTATGVLRLWLQTLPGPPLVHLLLVAVALLSIQRASNRLLAAKDVFQWTEYLLVGFMLFYGVFRSVIPVRKAVWLLLGPASVVLALGLWHYTTPAVAAFNVRATFGNRNVFGGYLSMMIPLAFGMLLHDRHPVRRTLYALIMAAGFTVMLAGGSFVAAMLALTALAAVKGPRVLTVFVITALAIGSLAAPLLPRDNAAIQHQSIMLCEADDESQMGQRYAEWQAALFMATDNPWRGIGIGNYQLNIGQWFGSLPDRAEPAEPDSQNLYLVVASSLGLPGLLLLAGMLLQAMARALRHAISASDPLDRGVALGALGALLGFAVNSLWSPLLVRGIGIPLMLVFALAYASGSSATASSSDSSGSDSGDGQPA